MKPQGSQKLAILLCRFKDTAQNESPDKHFFEDMKAGHAFVLNYSYERPSGIIKASEKEPGEYYEKTDTINAMNIDSEADDRFMLKRPLLTFQIWN
ncbi:hypothetical protein [Flavitalea sp.]|nr:hypothetical protein [Flavitalea sp.]